MPETPDFDQPTMLCAVGPVGRPELWKLELVPSPPPFLVRALADIDRMERECMPETPDFDQIARRIAEWTCEPTDRTLNEQMVEVVEQLRLVWNARGAADLVKLEADLSSMMGVTASGPYVKNLDRALRSLDR